MTDICAAGAANLNNAGTPLGALPVRFASYRNEDTGETTPLFLYSHEEIDAEIDRRICCNTSKSRPEHEATRAKFHALLDRDAVKNGVANV
jgi:hypothetical protein